MVCKNKVERTYGWKVRWGLLSRAADTTILHFTEEACGLQSGVYVSLFPPPHPVAFCSLFLFVKHSTTLVNHLLLHLSKSILVLLSMRNIRWEYSSQSIQNKYYTYCILNEKAWMIMFIVIHLNRWESKNMVAKVQR